MLNTNKCIEYKGQWKSEATGEAILSDCSSKREQKFEYIFTTAGRAAIAGKPLTEDQDGRPKVKEGMGVDAIGNFRCARTCSHMYMRAHPWRTMAG